MSTKKFDQIEPSLDVKGALADVSSLPTDGSTSQTEIVKELRPLIEQMIRQKPKASGAAFARILRKRHREPSKLNKQFERVVAKTVVEIKANMTPVRSSPPKGVPKAKHAIAKATERRPPPPSNMPPSDKAMNEAKRPYVWFGKFADKVFLSGQGATNEFFNLVKAFADQDKIEAAARAIYVSPESVKHCRNYLHPTDFQIIRDVLDGVGLKL